MTNLSVSNDIVNLEFYNSNYKSQVENYYLSKDQIKYTSFPLDAIAKCEKEAERFPVIILYNNVPAGFFILHGWEGVKTYSKNKNAILLRGYSINTPYQRKGIAKHSLKLLPSFVNRYFPDKNEIILAVNKMNTVAQQVYKKGGFIDKGVRKMGRKGELFILHKEL
jgi:RimJ/RimL family protein N-acetyltransferase